MEYIVREGEVKKTYLVIFDRERMQNILNEIVRTCSYKVDGRHIISKSVITKKWNELINGPVLPNGDPVFTNITHIYSTTSGNTYSVYDDSYGIFGTKTYAPELATIIKNVLDGNDENAIYELIQYGATNEMVDIDDKIELALEEAKKIDDADHNKKISALSILKALCEQKEKKEYFDAIGLQLSYEQIVDNELEFELLHVEYPSNPRRRIRFKELGTKYENEQD